MKRPYKRTILLIGAVSMLFSACKNSNSWFARQYRNTVSHYNVYFNAEQQYLEVYNTLRETNIDDYRRLIPIINLGDVAYLKSNQPQMDEVIKRTSTLIDKYPKSRWVDNAYLLNGKAYLLKGDLYAARDLFDYTSNTSKDPVIIYEAKILFGRSLLLQADKMQEAESYLLSLKEDKNFPKSNKAINLLLNQTLADMYMAQANYKAAYEPLKKSLIGVKGKLNKYRTYFAVAQVCMELEKYTEAQYFFNKCTKLNPPYEMAFQANIAQVQILSKRQKNYVKANKLLKRMLNDDKNIDYYGKIYYQLAENEMNAKNTNAAITYYNKSIAESKLKTDNQQLTTSYLALADYNFNKKNYLSAGNYYDSASNTIDEKYPNFEEILKRNDKLKILVDNIIQIQLQDSLLRMAKDPIFREKSIDNALEQEKKAAELLALQQQQQKNQPSVSPLGNMGSKSALPFYNPNLREQGKKEFERKWGKRPNEDNWRYAARLNKQKDKGGNANNSGSVTEDTGTIADPIISSAPPERRKFLEQIPLTSQKQDIAYQKMEEAYFAVANQYANSLDQPENGIKYFEEMLSKFPTTKSKPQIYYELVKLYTKIVKTDKADTYKKLLETDFSESNYLKILQGTGTEDKPLTTAGKEQKEVQDLYQSMYSQYINKQYATSLETKKNADSKFLGNALQPKFDYIQALCLIKLNEQEDAFKILENIILDYPKTDIAEMAQSLIDAKKNMDNPVEAITPGAVSDWTLWNNTEDLMYILVFDKKNNSNMLRAALADYCKKDYVLEELVISNAQVSGNQVMIYVSGFSEPQIVKDFYGRLQSNPAMYNSKGLFEFDHGYISASNLALLSSNFQFSSYFNFFKKLTN